MKTPVYTPSPATASPPVPSSARISSVVVSSSAWKTSARTVAPVSGSPPAVRVAVIVTGSPAASWSRSAAAARTTPVPAGSCTSAAVVQAAPGRGAPVPVTSSVQLPVSGAWMM